MNVLRYGNHVRGRSYATFARLFVGVTFTSSYHSVEEEGPGQRRLEQLRGAGGFRRRPAQNAATPPLAMRMLFAPAPRAAPALVSKGVPQRFLVRGATSLRVAARDARDEDALVENAEDAGAHRSNEQGERNAEAARSLVLVMSEAHRRHELLPMVSLRHLCRGGGKGGGGAWGEGGAWGVAGAAGWVGAHLVGEDGLLRASDVAVRCFAVEAARTVRPRVRPVGVIAWNLVVAEVACVNEVVLDRADAAAHRGEGVTFEEQKPQRGERGEGVGDRA